MDFLWVYPEGGGGGDRGVRTLLKNHKKMGFLSNTGPDGSPEKSQLSYQASIQCWAIMGTPVKHHLMVFHWRTHDGLLKVTFGSFLSPSKTLSKVDPADKTFWSHACFLNFFNKLVLIKMNQQTVKQE